MISNVALCLGVCFTILNVVFIYNQIKRTKNVILYQNTKALFKEKYVMLDCIVFMLCIIFFYNIYFYDVELQKTRDDKIFMVMIILFISIVVLTLINVLFFIKKKIKVEKKRWIFTIIIYCVIICLMEISSRQCKMITDLLWNDYFFGHIFIYMHFLVKICFYTAISPLIYFLSNIVVKNKNKNYSEKDFQG